MNLGSLKKEGFTQALLQIDKKIHDAVVSEIVDTQQSELPKKAYWQEANKLLEMLMTNSNDEKINVEGKLKQSILESIKSSIVRNNYWLANLIVYDEISTGYLIDFLFYVSLSREISYEMFKSNPDKYGTTFMFNFHPTQLPKLKRILSDEEYGDFLTSTNADGLIKRLLKVSSKEFTQEFPKSYRRFSKINPFVLGK
jgi:hypothetical protein